MTTPGPGSLPPYQPAPPTNYGPPASPPPPPAGLPPAPQQRGPAPAATYPAPPPPGVGYSTAPHPAAEPPSSFAAPNGFAAPYGQQAKTNTMAILGLVFAFVFSPLGVVFSALGLSQTKQRGEGGRGLALAGLIISIISIVVSVVILVLALTVWSAALKAADDLTPATPPATATATEDVLTEAPSADTGATAAEDPEIVAACTVIVPVLDETASELSAATTPQETIDTLNGGAFLIQQASSGVSDPDFVQDAYNMYATMQAVANSLSHGEDASGNIAVLDTFQSTLEGDCTAAGYTG